MAGLLTLQGKITTTGTAQELTSNPGQYHQLTLTAKSTNTAPIAVNVTSGNTAVDGTGTSYILEKGTSVQLTGLDNTNAIWVSGTTGDIYSILGDN